MNPAPPRLAMLAALLAVLAILAAPTPLAAQEGWASETTHNVELLGRDGPEGREHYRITIRPGASFFAIADGSVPLEPIPQTLEQLRQAFNAAFPDRPDAMRPGDQFDLYLPAGTLVGKEWREAGNRVREFRSLKGDIVTLYYDYRSPLSHSVVRADNPGWAEVSINHEAEFTAQSLAQAIYGQGRPDFKPDYLQVLQAQEAIQKRMETVEVDLSREYMDEFREIRDSAEAAGKSPEGLSVYLIQSSEVAQPFFRVDDGIGEITDPREFPPLIRVYYYKNGVVRSYQRAEDSIWLSGRQPKIESWARAFADYGRMEKPPTRWGVGQPEESAQAQQMTQLGISVLRYDREEPPRGNFLTQLLDMLMGLMKGKS